MIPRKKKTPLLSQQIDQGVTSSLLGQEHVDWPYDHAQQDWKINVVESQRIINWHQSTIISKWYPLTSTYISTYIHSYPPTSTYIPISSCLKHFKTTSYYLHHSESGHHERSPPRTACWSSETGPLPAADIPRLGRRRRDWWMAGVD